MAIEPCPSNSYNGPGFGIGWYSILRSSELQVGEVMRVRCFDRELALYRSRSGKAVVHDAFCPHLGAHLGVEGRVVGEALQCPFHGWRFGTDGNCESIPYCDEIPGRAKVRNWNVCEVNQEIMIWFHPEEKAPAWEVPVVEELSHPDWAETRTWEFTVPNHVQNIAENTCDPEHFQFVHKNPETPPSEITIAEDGRRLTLTSDGRNAAVPHILTATMHNPGLAVVRSHYAEGMEMMVYSTAQPISLHETLLRWQLTVTRNIVDAAGEDSMRGIMAGINDDMPIWQHKIYRDKPLFCKADEGLVTFRKWVRQFYTESTRFAAGRPSLIAVDSSANDRESVA